MICIADTSRPTDNQVEEMFSSNGAGAGAAWRENGHVRWEKGVEVDRIKELCRELPLPFIAHFRIPTEGGKRPQLCHPFPIEMQVPLMLKGHTKGYVLFHNGHWGDWRRDMKDTLIKHPKALIPRGKWSDTRGMAWMASIYGLSILELINEKAVAFGPRDMEIINGSGWYPMDGMWFSNKVWENKQWHNTRGDQAYFGGGHHYVNEMCKFGQCHRKDINRVSGYCPAHDPEKKEAKSASDTTLEAEYDVWDGESPGHVDSTDKGGGPAKDLPFLLACQQFKEGKLSHKKWKKARRAYEDRERERKKLMKRNPVQRAFEQLKDMAILVKH